MELTKKELGQFLELLDNRNSLMKYGVEYVRGVNNLKCKCQYKNVQF